MCSTVAGDWCLSSLIFVNNGILHSRSVHVTLLMLQLYCRGMLEVECWFWKLLGTWTLWMKLYGTFCNQRSLCCPLLQKQLSELHDEEPRDWSEDIRSQIERWVFMFQKVPLRVMKGSGECSLWQLTMPIISIKIGEIGKLAIFYPGGSF